MWNFIIGCIVGAGVATFGLTGFTDKLNDAAHVVESQYHQVQNSDTMEKVKKEIQK